MTPTSKGRSHKSQSQDATRGQVLLVRREDSDVWGLGFRAWSVHLAWGITEKQLKNALLS